MVHDGIFVDLGPELVNWLCGIVSEGSGLVSFENDLMGSDLAILCIEGIKNLNDVLVDTAGGGILDLIQPLAIVRGKEDID